MTARDNDITTDKLDIVSTRVFGNSAKETSAPPSVWRYNLLMNRPENSDSQFMWGEFIARNNNELLNNLGNFVNRVRHHFFCHYLHISKTLIIL